MNLSSFSLSRVRQAFRGYERPSLVISVSLHHEGPDISSICEPCKQAEASRVTKVKLWLFDLAHMSAYYEKHSVSQAAESGLSAGASHRMGTTAPFLGFDPSAESLSPEVVLDGIIVHHRQCRLCSAWE